VIDGGSTDGTLDVLKKYERRLTWVSEPDLGQADAINKGIQRSTGEVLAFINSDDYYLPGVFNKVAGVFMKKPDCQWMTGDYMIVNQHNHPIQSFVVTYKRIIRRFPGLGTLKLTNYISQPSTFWRRNVHEEIGRFNITYRYAFDYDFWLRLMIAYPPCYIKESISAFRVHSMSKGGKEYRYQFDEELKVLGKYNCSRLDYLLHKVHNEMIVGIYRWIK